MARHWRSALIPLLLVACASGVALAQADPFAEAREEFRIRHQAQIEAAAAACRDRGGEFGYRGLALAPFCTTRLPDGGTECASKSDCQGDCIVDLEQRRIDWMTLPKGTPVAGQCTSVSPHLGCYVTVRDGRAAHAICAD